MTMHMVRRPTGWCPHDATVQQSQHAAVTVSAIWNSGCGSLAVIALYLDVL